MTVTIKQINARSVQIGKASAKLANDIHSHSVTIAAFIKETGNVTPAGVFITALSTGTRREAVAAWFGGLVGVNLTKNDDGTITAKRQKAFPLDQIDLDQCKAISPFDYAPEKDWKQFDLMKMLEGVVKRAEKAQEEGAPEGKSHAIPADKLAAIKAILA